MGMRVHTTLMPALQRPRQKEGKLRTTLGYIASLGPSWATYRDPDLKVFLLHITVCKCFREIKIVLGQYLPQIPVHLEAMNVPYRGISSLQV